MLSPEIIKKIKKIHIRSRRQVDTMMAGQYKSVFRGTGMEFEEVREYTPGDEVKNIDWKVSARMGRPFIKLYKEEREVVVMLLVDMSASGNFGTASRMKRETAAEIASILAFNAIRNNDKVGVILFTDRVEKYIPPKKGSAHIWRVIKEVFTFKPEHAGTDIEDAIQFLGRVSRKKTVSFVVSDFLAEGYEKKMKVASKRHELIAVLLSDPHDFILPGKGLVLAQDFETGDSVIMDASDRRTRENYGRLKQNEYRLSLETIRKTGVDCIELDTRASVADVLIKYFRYRERLVR
ncbi:MAG: DUF58 domain-containing protein [Proteobacteria bacterium]|nr:DUF58 domain-containing protein [Pseudomonadota bacterium]